MWQKKEKYIEINRLATCHLYAFWDILLDGTSVIIHMKLSSHWMNGSRIWKEVKLENVKLKGLPILQIFTCNLIKAAVTSTSLTKLVTNTKPWLDTALWDQQIYVQSFKVRKLWQCDNNITKQSSAGGLRFLTFRHCGDSHGWLTQTRLCLPFALIGVVHFHRGQRGLLLVHSPKHHNLAP